MNVMCVMRGELMSASGKRGYNERKKEEEEAIK